MRRIARAVGLAVALTALAGTGASLKADPPGEPICPVCIADYKCCIKGNKATCIPSSQSC